MRNFQYIATYNLEHPLIQQLLKEILQLQDSITKFTITSKYFIGFSEAVEHAKVDFHKKIKEVFSLKTDADGEVYVKMVMVMNPKFVADDLPEDLASTIRWDDSTFASLFFCENNDDDDELPTTWLVRYEVKFIDDKIEMNATSGQLLFDLGQLPLNDYTSSLH